MDYALGEVIIYCLAPIIPAFVDTSLGMGYGFTVTPTLLLLGFSPIEVVPAVLLSSIVGDILSSLFHHQLKNVDFSLHSRETKISLVVGILGGLGAIFGALVTLSLPAFYLRLYIGTLVTIMGFFVLFTRKRKGGEFSWGKMLGLAVMGSFNKGLTGSGFGSIVTSGGLLIGIKEKAAVSIQCFAETFVCITGLLTFALSKVQVNWYLALFVSLGVALSSFPAAFFVSKMDSKTLRWMIALAAIILGLAILIRLFF